MRSDVEFSSQNKHTGITTLQLSLHFLARYRPTRLKFVLYKYQKQSEIQHLIFACRLHRK